MTGFMANSLKRQHAAQYIVSLDEMMAQRREHMQRHEGNDHIAKFRMQEIGNVIGGLVAGILC
jgi:hypothetical protein